MEGGQQPIWEELHNKLPWHLTDEQKKSRMKMWKEFDVNGNGILSLAEIERGMKEVVKIPELFDLKPVITKAFNTARNKSKSTAQKSYDADDYI